MQSKKKEEETVERQREDKQREWALQVIFTCPVISALTTGLTTGLTPATFPRGLSPAETPMEPQYHAPFSSLSLISDVRDLFKLTVCVARENPPSVKCVSPAQVDDRPVTQAHENMSVLTAACLHGEAVLLKIAVGKIPKGLTSYTHENNMLMWSLKYVNTLKEREVYSLFFGHISICWLPLVGFSETLIA